MAKITLKALQQKSLDRNNGAYKHLEPIVYKKGLEIIAECYKEGIYIVFAESFRSMTDQARIFGQGRNSYIYKGKQYGNPSKPIVSNAMPGQSNHNYGIALDAFQTDSNGNGAYWTVDSKFKRFVAIAKSKGFTWGGDWKSFPDYPHIQYTGKIVSVSKPNTSNKPSTNTSKPNTSLSLVDYLNSKKIDSSFANRSKLATKHGIKNYTGTASQNEKLLSLIKSGKVDKPVSTSKPVEKENSDLYFYKNPKKVISKTTVKLYNNAEFDKVTGGEYPKGTPFTITGIVKSKKGTPRLKTSSGFYLTANKDYVKQG